jgi:hypothetical protein
LLQCAVLIIVGGAIYYSSQYINEEQKQLLDKIARSIWADSKEHGQKRQHEADHEGSTIATATQSATPEIHNSTAGSQPATVQTKDGSIQEDNAILSTPISEVFTQNPTEKFPYEEGDIFRQQESRDQQDEATRGTLRKHSSFDQTLMSSFKS